MGCACSWWIGISRRPGRKSPYLATGSTGVPDLANGLSRPGLIDLLLKVQVQLREAADQPGRGGIHASRRRDRGIRAAIAKEAALADKVQNALSNLPEHLRGSQPIERVPTDLPAFVSWLYDSGAAPFAGVPRPPRPHPSARTSKCVCATPSRIDRTASTFYRRARGRATFAGYAEAVQDFDGPSSTCRAKGEIISPGLGNS